MSQTRIGFIGLGQMGGAIARNLQQRFGGLVVYDTSYDAVKSVVAEGANACTRVEDVLSLADIIILCLPDADQVEKVLINNSGVFASRSAQPIVLDMTTLEQDRAVAFAQRCDEIGIQYCDCPVSGLPKRALDGSLTVMFGGAKATYEQVTRYLDAVASKVIYCGGVGTGQAMKAVNNIVYNINIAAFCEILPLAVAAGLEPAAVAEMMTTGSSRSFASEHFIPKILSRRFSDDFSMHQAYKDIQNLRQLEQATGADIPVTRAMIGTYEAALQAGFGQEPKHAMVKVYEQVLNQPGLVRE